MSDLVPNHSFPIFKSDSGHAGFSCAKNSLSLHHVSDRICINWKRMNGHSSEMTTGILLKL